jgi:hypothetical protein
VLWIILSILGIVVPYSQVVPWVMENGVDIPRFFTEAVVNRPAATHVVDLFLSAAIFFVFAFRDPRRPGGGVMAALVAGTLAIGLCFGMPLYFYLRRPEPANA